DARIVIDLERWAERALPSVERQLERDDGLDRGVRRARIERQVRGVEGAEEPYLEHRPERHSESLREIAVEITRGGLQGGARRSAEREGRDALMRGRHTARRRIAEHPCPTVGTRR